MVTLVYVPAVFTRCITCNAIGSWGTHWNDYKYDKYMDHFFLNSRPVLCVQIYQHIYYHSKWNVLGFSKTNIDFTIICYKPFIFDTVYKCYRIFLLLCLFNVTFLSSNLLLKSICWWLFNKNTHIFTIMIKSENMKRYLYWHMFLFSLIKVHRNEKKGLLW